MNFVRLWILFSMVLVSAGWILSAIHQLNRAGYAVFLLPLVIFVFVRWNKTGQHAGQMVHRWRCKLAKRFRRRPPQLFLLIAVLSFAGGGWYPPLNFDANAYRLPRVMHWLAAGQWHWIHTFDARMNISACGMEWLSAPLILFTRSDRLLFLINLVSYLMLPGMLYSVFTHLCVRPRAAWWWTWLLSAGLCFALQAGGIANDTFAVIYSLAAVDLALRAREKQCVADLWLSLLAAALLTGAKQSNLPLAPLWLIAAWPARSLLWQNPLRSVAVALVALLISAVPISVINYHYLGSWMPVDVPGIATLGKFQLNPFWGIVGNALSLPVQNLVPPFYTLFPPLHSYWPLLWNDWMRQFAGTPMGAHFASFERFGFLTEAYYRGVTEANAGIGFWVCVMVLATGRALRRWRKTNGLPAQMAPASSVILWLRWTPWALLVVFMAKNGAFENARQLAPYYPFLFVAWLARPGQSSVTRDRAWQQLALAGMVIAALLVATAPERPLFPAQTLSRLAHSHFPGSDFVEDEFLHYAESGYCQMAARRDYLRDHVPTGESMIGYYDKLFAADEAGLWLPYGRRQVYSVMPDESPDALRRAGAHFVVVDASSALATDGTIDHWLRRFNATVVGQYTFPLSTAKPSDLPGLYLTQLL